MTERDFRQVQLHCMPLGPHINSEPIYVDVADYWEAVDEIDRLRNIIKNRRCGDCMMEGE